MPSLTPEERARRLAARNRRLNTVDSPKPKPKRKPRRGTEAGRRRGDPDNTLRRRTQRALRSRIARAGGVRNLGPGDRALAEREGINIDDLF
jgi:hypothetical protein